LDGIADALRLNESNVEASRAVLHDFGNVSSSTTWCVRVYKGIRLGPDPLLVPACMHSAARGVRCIM
jgi:hypothetical protein